MAFAVLIGLVPAACSGPDSPAFGVAKATGFATDPPPAPDFITQSRPPDATFIPVAQPRSSQAAPKSPDEVRRAEAELERLRKKHEAEAKADPPAPTN